MHFIQQHILDTLSNAKNLRNKDMRPKGVESNLYQYHLLQLQQLGFIKKNDNMYELSAKGLAYADRQSSKLKKERIQPKLITILFIKTPKGIILLPKLKQPFISTYSLPSGKIHLGESIYDSAKREAYEKAKINFDTKELSISGYAHFTIRQQETSISEFYAVLFSVDTKVFDNPDAIFVNSIEELDSSITPGVSELFKMYFNGENFLEITIEV